MYSVHFRKMLQDHEVLSSGKRIISYLKGNSDDDQTQWISFVGLSGSRLRDALIVAVEEDKEVGYCFFVSRNFAANVADSWLHSIVAFV